MSRCTGLLIAGGPGTRLGMPKAALKFGGHSLLQTLCRRLSRVCEEVLIVTADEVPLWQASEAETVVEACSRLEGIRVVSDRVPNSGPLGALWTGLCEARADWAFAAACDMPFITEAVVDCLKRYSDGMDVVVPESDGRPQPLCALYRSSIGRCIEERLRAADLSLMGLLKDPRVRVHTVKTEVWLAEGIPPFSFMNLNTAQDVTAAQEMIERVGP